MVVVIDVSFLLRFYDGRKRRAAWVGAVGSEVGMGVRKTLVGRVYQLHITLRGIRPPIWRRVQAPGSLTLAPVHDVIQRVFGWTNCHLHQFFIGRVSYGQPDDFDQVVLHEAGVTLAEALGTRIKRFL